MRLLFIMLLLLFMISCSTSDEQKAELVAHDRAKDISNLKQIRPAEIYNIKTDSLNFRSKTAVAKLHYFEENIGEMTSEAAKALTVENIQSDKFFGQNATNPELYSHTSNGSHMNRYLLITFDNDIFAETDYYYTNGFSVGLIHPWLDNRLFYSLMPGLGQYSTNLFGFRIQQQMFTPYEPEAVAIDPNDRPFSGVLVAEFFKLSNRSDKMLFLQTSLRMGVIGPASLAGALQNSLHKLEPTGWENQIANDFLLNIDLSLQKAFKIGKSIEMAGNMDAGIGTFKTYWGASLQIRTGNFSSINSTISSATIGVLPKFDKTISYWIFLEPAFHFIAYDATLNGGMLNKTSPHRFSYNEIHHRTTQLNAGFSVFYRNTGLSLRWTRISPEFIGGDLHNWGNISLTHNF